MAIQVLDGISHIRLKSAMWVGETSDATHLLNEVLDNSLDEVISSHADSLTIDISSDSTVTVSDNGRGIPTDDHLGEPLPVVICTAMFSSGKFDNDMYNLHIGLHGVGLTAVNALSEFLEITTDDGKKNLFVRFEDSKLVDQTIIDSTGITGTTVKFKPSSQYFDNPVINTSFLEDRLDITMAVCKNLKITYNGNILKQLDLKDLIEKPKTKGLYIIRSSAKIGENSVEVLFTYGDDRKSKAYVNLLPCSTGTHLSLTESSISKIWLDIIGKDKVWSGDTLRGLHTVISVFLENPSFSAQIKTSLTNKKSELTDLFNLLRENLSKALDKHPDMVSLMSAKMIEYRSMLTRIDSDSYVQQILDKGVVDQDGNVKRMTKNQRLIECSSTHRDTTQLYIVEGACFTGDTEILDVNFNKITFKELSTRVDPCYTFSCSKDGEIVVSKINNCWVTKESNELVEIKLDNEKTIKCTPDHEFMLRNGEYCKAIDLMSGDSLMPIYYNTSGEYNTVRNNYHYKGRYGSSNVFHLSSIHKDCINKSTEDRINRHHLDLDKKNDYPNNIEIWDEDKHRVYHGNLPNIYKLPPRFDSSIKLYPEYFNEFDNHTVTEVRIISLDSPIEFYDLEVDSEFHNFPLAAGIFVHNSAAGSLIKSRDEKLHAVFPLRGKITNVVDMGMDDVFKSAEIKDLINAIGTQVGKWEDIANLRYGKILITADADPDGKSIENLLIGLFAYLLPKTLKAGYVYIVEAPLYKQGNNYFYDESQLDKRKPFGRFKGLGEMDFVEAEETLIKNPRLIQVIVNSDDDLNYVKSLVRSSKYKRDLLIDKKMLVGH